uniref:Uncharacterized protein n=1 Tax=Chromera velia CCMP2878 TaxID=1169474 RepID=A0A0G4HJQ1_9ALVE|eukprot:Cvel_7114.t1-p1 / transcript=Cvel_7114.t1 / gene=Cvel_7114 / organism=Chromera_velia_CCMP2878 / gene_product=hypothetical protein / transcript_product=hypothetical protein / location=Cvel_scaffold364:78061-80742(-) / protein_length=894 / sequence_SO=supercontig / SO=protein_coding / is_pseudo=false
MVQNNRYHQSRYQRLLKQKFDIFDVCRRRRSAWRFALFYKFTAVWTLLFGIGSIIFWWSIVGNEHQVGYPYDDHKLHMDVTGIPVCKDEGFSCKKCYLTALWGFKWIPIGSWHLLVYSTLLCAILFIIDGILSVGLAYSFESFANIKRGDFIKPTILQRFVGMACRSLPAWRRGVWFVRFLLSVYLFALLAGQHICRDTWPDYPAMYQITNCKNWMRKCIPLPGEGFWVSRKLQLKDGVSEFERSINIDAVRRIRLCQSDMRIWCSFPVGCEDALGRPTSESCVWPVQVEYEEKPPKFNYNQEYGFESSAGVCSGWPEFEIPANPNLWRWRKIWQSIVQDPEFEVRCKRIFEKYGKPHDDLMETPHCRDRAGSSKCEGDILAVPDPSSRQSPQMWTSTREERRREAKLWVKCVQAGLIPKDFASDEVDKSPTVTFVQMGSNSSLPVPHPMSVTTPSLIDTTENESTQKRTQTGRVVRQANGMHRREGPPSAKPSDLPFAPSSSFWQRKEKEVRHQGRKKGDGTPAPNRATSFEAPKKADGDNPPKTPHLTSTPAQHVSIESTSSTSRGEQTETDSQDPPSLVRSSWNVSRNRPVPLRLSVAQTDLRPNRIEEIPEVDFEEDEESDESWGSDDDDWKLINSDEAAEDSSDEDYWDDDDLDMQAELIVGQNIEMAKEDFRQHGSPYAPTPVSDESDDDADNEEGEYESQSNTPPLPFKLERVVSAPELGRVAPSRIPGADKQHATKQQQQPPSAKRRPRPTKLGHGPGYAKQAGIHLPKKMWDYGDPVSGTPFWRGSKRTYVFEPKRCPAFFPGVEDFNPSMDLSSAFASKLWTNLLLYAWVCLVAFFFDRLLGILFASKTLPEACFFTPPSWKMRRSNRQWIAVIYDWINYRLGP